MRVIALGEGRLIEAMTGERMPRRPVHPGPGAGWLARIGAMLTDARTWTTLLYLMLMLPLGIVYFTLATLGLALGRTPAVHAAADHRRARGLVAGDRVDVRAHRRCYLGGDALGRRRDRLHAPRRAAASAVHARRPRHRPRCTRTSPRRCWSVGRRERWYTRVHAARRHALRPRHPGCGASPHPATAVRALAPPRPVTLMPEARPPPARRCPPAAAHGCLAGGNGYLRAVMRGALNLDLDWRNAELECEGGPRPDGSGLRVSFAGPAQADGHRLRHRVRRRVGARGQPGRELPTNLTVIFEGEERLFATRGDDHCTVDELRQERVGALGGPRRSWRIVARGFCIAPASTLNSDARLLHRSSISPAAWCSARTRPPSIPEVPLMPPGTSATAPVLGRAPRPHRPDCAAGTPSVTGSRSRCSRRLPAQTLHSAMRRSLRRHSPDNRRRGRRRRRRPAVNRWPLDHGERQAEPLRDADDRDPPQYVTRVTALVAAAAPAADQALRFVKVNRGDRHAAPVGELPRRQCPRAPVIAPDCHDAALS